MTDRTDAPSPTDSDAPAGGAGRPNDERPPDERRPDEPRASSQERRSALDRRTFLKRAGAAGAGAALGLGATGGEAGASEVPAAEGSRRTVRKAPHIHRGIPDVIVVGAGAFGAWTAFYLRRMGLDTLLIDKYGPGNSKATSGGETRGVRTSYGNRETPLWCAWAAESIRRWKRYDEEWADRIPAPLFYTTGDVILREEEGNFIANNRVYFDEVGVAYEMLDGDETSYRWPVIDTENVDHVLYERDAGVVRARRAIETVAGIFQDEGGRLEIAEARISGTTEGRIHDLELDDGTRLQAGRYVFALGPWMPLFFPEVLGETIRIPMGHVFYYGTPAGDQRFTWPNVPSYNVPGVTGWPALPPDNRGFRVRTGGSQHPDPDTSPRWVPLDKFERPRGVLRDYFPDMADAPLIETRTCHYESSRTGNWIIDRHPDYANAWFAGGGSAEAFKFGPVNGEFVAKRVMEMDEDPELAEVFRLTPVEEEGEPGEAGDADASGKAQLADTGATDDPGFPYGHG